MLTELCAFLKNYFLRDGTNDLHSGTFTIENGSIEALDFLQPGQYYRIAGSVFNDGVHKYGDTSENAELLVDETFSGVVWAMAVPPTVIALAGEIAEWNTANAAALSGPYQSESFGGYSYSKGTSTNGGAYSWRDAFAARLTPYRRLSVL